MSCCLRKATWCMVIISPYVSLGPCCEHVLLVLGASWILRGFSLQLDVDCLFTSNKQTSHFSESRGGATCLLLPPNCGRGFRAEAGRRRPVPPRETRAPDGPNRSAQALCRIFLHFPVARKELLSTRIFVSISPSFAGLAMFVREEFFLSEYGHVLNMGTLSSGWHSFGVFSRTTGGRCVCVCVCHTHAQSNCLNTGYLFVRFSNWFLNLVNHKRVLTSYQTWLGHLYCYPGFPAIGVPLRQLG